MSNNDLSSKSTYPLSGREERLEYVTWKTTSPMERTLLERVEQRIDASDWLREPPPLQKGQEDPKETSFASPWIWTIPACAATCIVLLLLWKPLTPTPAQRHSKTAQRASIAPKKAAPTQPLELNVPTHKSVHIGNAKTWKATLYGGTKLQLQTFSARRVQMVLEQGMIYVHVRPGTMKSVVIRWKGRSSLVVKGTRFTVEQRKDWLRLEVTRGVVAWQHPKYKQQLVRAGSGIRITTRTDKVTRYTLAPSSASTVGQKLAWIAKHAPKQLCITAQDWSRRPNLSKAQKRMFLSTYAYQFQGMGHVQCSIALFMRLYDLRESKQDGELALVSAAQSCQTAQRTHASCITLYRTYLQMYPKGLHRKRVQMWLRKASK